jgi:hypothetical protein
MLILECSQGCYAVKFWPGYLDLWDYVDFQGRMSKIKVTGSNFYRIISLWTLESTSFNGFLTKLGTYLVFKITETLLIGFQILLRTKYICMHSLFGDSENRENNYLKIRDLLSIALFNILGTHYAIHIWEKIVKEIIQIIKKISIGPNTNFIRL